MCARLCGWVDAPTLPAPQNTDMFSTKADGAFWWGQRPRIVVLAFSVYIYMYLCGCVCLSGGVRVPTDFPSDAPKLCQKMGAILASKNGVSFWTHHRPRTVSRLHRNRFLHLPSCMVARAFNHHDRITITLCIVRFVWSMARSSTTSRLRH